MLHLPIEILEKIVRPKREPGESATDFFHRLLPIAHINRATLRCYHSAAYETVHVDLDPDENEPLLRLFNHMTACTAAAKAIRTLSLSGLVEGDIDGPVHHDLHAADLMGLLRLTPNLTTLRLKHFDMVPASNDWLPTLPPSETPIPATIQRLELYWLRFDRPSSFDKLRYLTPGLETLRANQIYWEVPYPVRTLIHDDVSPRAAQLIDISPDYPPLTFHLFQLGVSPWMGSTAFGARLTRLHLGAHDQLAVLPETFETWEALQFEAMPALQSLTLSVPLGSLHRQESTTLFTAAAARILLRCSRMMLTLYITLLADELAGTYPDDPIEFTDWYLLRAAAAAHGTVGTVITFVDSDVVPINHVPARYTDPIERAFLGSHMTLLYMYIARTTWDRAVLLM